LQGSLTCATDFGATGAYAGYCNLACELQVLDHPAVFFDEATQSAVATYLVDHISAATGESLDASGAAAAMQPGLCQSLVTLDTQYCEAILNGAAASNPFGSTGNFGLCDFACGACAVPCTNGLDLESGDGTCDTLISQGYGCVAYFAAGTEYAGLCDAFCDYCGGGGDSETVESSCSNALDEEYGAGTCTTYLAGGYTCSDHFAVGMEYGGYCDQDCDTCSHPYVSTCKVTDVYDSFVSDAGVPNHGHCATLISTGQLSCSTDDPGTSLGVGGAYAGYCSLACQFNRLEHHSLFLHETTVLQIATVVKTWLSEMGGGNIVESDEEALLQMVGPSVLDGVHHPGICERLITGLGADRMCRGTPGTDIGVFPGSLNPATCADGYVENMLCEGLCEFACGECQNTEIGYFVAEGVRASCEEAGACCSISAGEEYQGDTMEYCNLIANGGNMWTIHTHNTFLFY
jgi:hypothetical protein